MGTDNLFHKRKERKAELLRRRQAMKAPYDVILIAPANDSICAKVIEELMNHLPAYQKGDQDIFNKIQDKLDNAITNARSIVQYHQTSGTDNPSTMVHSMVEYLRDLKKQ
jgi:hypothetical protein